MPAIGGRARARRRDGAGHRLRHPPAQQSARAQISQGRARPLAGGGRRLVRALDQRRACRARSHGERRAPASSCSATRRRSPTSALSRSSTMRGASTCRSTIIRRCCAPKRMPTSSRRSPPRILTARRCPHEPRRQHQPRHGRHEAARIGRDPVARRARSATRNGRSASTSPPLTGWSLITAGTTSSSPIFRRGSRGPSIISCSTRTI